MSDQRHDPPGVNENTTLASVREWVDIMAYGEGVRCPCCGQHAKVYHRTITSSMARALIMFWRVGRTKDWVHGPTILGGARADEGKLRYWGLLQESHEKRDDGGRAGYWRVTDKGEQFVNATIRVPRYALIYDGACLGFDGTEIDVHGALRNRFDYNALMAGPVIPLQRNRRKK